MMTSTRPSSSRELCPSLLFIFLCCSLSWCSSSSPSTRQIDKSSSSSRVVTHLPGFHGPLPFHLQTGYVEVDGGNGVRLFYYFVPSERSPADDPLMLWLNGGPGCSALTGLAYEIAILFHSKNEEDDIRGLIHYTPKNFIFADSFITFADSRIARGIEVSSKPALNLKGYIVGNPVTDFNFDGPSKIPFAHGMGLISDEMYEAYEKSCSVGDSSHQSVDCVNSLVAIDECVKGICPGHILEPLCNFASPNKPTLKLNSSAREILQLQYDTADAELHLSEISLQCRTAGYLKSYIWANNASVREALGIHKGTVPFWIRCNYGIAYVNNIQSTVNYHLDVTTKGYTSLVYSGDHDMVIPFIGTQVWIKSLGFSVVDKWRPWYVDGQLAGQLSCAGISGTRIRGAVAPRTCDAQQNGRLARRVCGSRKSWQPVRDRK